MLRLFMALRKNRFLVAYTLWHHFDCCLLGPASLQGSCLFVPSCVLDDHHLAPAAILTTLRPRHVSSILICGYYGSKYRVRLYPLFGYSILYKEYYLTRFNHQKNTTHVTTEGPCPRASHVLQAGLGHRYGLRTAALNPDP